MCADEALISPIPPNREEASNLLLDEVDVLGGCRRRRRGYVLLPKRTYGWTVLFATGRKVAFN